MKKLLLIIPALLLSACGLNEADFKSLIPERPAFENRVIQPSLAEVVPETNELPSSLPIPSQVNLKTPFYSQAPEGEWVLPWSEACEEASLILAHYGMAGKTLAKKDFKQMILDMVQWQMEYFGSHEDITIDQTQLLYKNFFEDAFDTKILENPNLTELMAELAQGHLMVAPFAGRMLGNPFYSGEGPYYHMMVIKGYDGENFITSDVGTKRGENFIYSYQTLMSALHDYRPNAIENGESRVLVLLPKS